MIPRGCAAGLLLATACLGPQTSDLIDPAHVFGPADIDPATAQHVEDDPLLAPKVALFPTSVAYLRGWADGAPIWYWNVAPPLVDFIVPYFVVVASDGTAGRAIIDELPGDAGYSPWWRRTIVRTTPSYKGERIWSRAAVEAGISAGILSAPEPTTLIVDCPVVSRTVKVPLGNGMTAGTEWVWYRNHRVDWVRFSGPSEVPTDVRQMPKYPVYILQRINQSAPIYEFLTGVDLNGDGQLNASNNIFAANVGGKRYSPLWQGTIVRVTKDYPSLDTTRTGSVGFSMESQLVDDAGANKPGVLSVAPIPGLLVNCPIQTTKGSL